MPFSNIEKFAKRISVKKVNAQTADQNNLLKDVLKQILEFKKDISLIDSFLSRKYFS